MICTSESVLVETGSNHLEANLFTEQIYFRDYASHCDAESIYAL